MQRATTAAARLAGGRAFAAGLALLALVALLAWGASPYGRYLSHAYEPAGAGGQAGAIAAFLGGWLLMTTAMTLPVAGGLVLAFDRRTEARDERERLRLRLLLIAGLLAVWLLVGYLFRAADVLVHAAVDASGWLSARPGLVAALTLAVAGVFQFLPLKRRCLAACRAPHAFVARGWTDADPHRDALRIGVAYGRSGVGCCWALMLVMFGLGTTHAALMAGLAAVMAAERFAPARVPVGALAGAVLLGAAAAVALSAAT